MYAIILSVHVICQLVSLLPNLILAYHLYIQSGIMDVDNESSTMTNPQKIYIIYASVSGNTELVVEHAAGILRDKGWQVNVSKAEQTSINILSENNIFLLGTSTWEHGRINPYFDTLLKEMAEQDLSGKQAGFVGLGDHRYEPVLFCGGAKKLRDVFMQQGGEEVGEMLMIDGEPNELLDSSVREWVDTFYSRISS